jgi:GST-like protein
MIDAHVRAPEKLPAVIERFTQEADRRFGVLDRRLAQVPYLAGARAMKP